MRRSRHEVIFHNGSVFVYDRENLDDSSSPVCEVSLIPWEIQPVHADGLGNVEQLRVVSRPTPIIMIMEQKP